MDKLKRLDLRLKILLALVACLLLAGAALAALSFSGFFTAPQDLPAAANEEIELSRLHSVERIIDGDTVRVNINGKVESVRLIGIDAPEMIHPERTVECFAEEAAARAEETLAGQRIRLGTDPTQGDRDRYGRLLRYIYLRDGTNFNYQMVASGYAYEYTFLTPYLFQAEFRAAEQSAREEERGLWAKDTCAGLTSGVPDVELAPPALIDIAPAPGCVHYGEVGKYIGETTCVTGPIDHIRVSATNTTFINYCEDYRTCPFSAVIFSDDKAKFPNIRELEGEIITIEGEISTYQGRPQIILRNLNQIKEE